MRRDVMIAPGLRVGVLVLVVAWLGSACRA
jgi:hypothetical protein